MVDVTRSVCFSIWGRAIDASTMMAHTHTPLITNTQSTQRDVGGDRVSWVEVILGGKHSNRRAVLVSGAVMVMVRVRGERQNVAGTALRPTGAAITVNREQTFACEWIDSGPVD